LHPELLGLLEAARAADEDDLTPFLVLIDWLEEHGGEEEKARAQLLRWQCEAKSLVEESRDHTELLERMDQFEREHRAAWLGCLADVVRRWAVLNGLYQVTYSAQMFTEQPAFESAEARVVWPWVREIRLLGISRVSSETLTRAPFPAGLVALTLRSGRRVKSIGRERLQALLDLPQLDQLRELDLDFCRMGQAGMAVLAESPRLRQLRRLNLRGNNLLPKGLKRLTASPHLGELLELALSFNPARPEGVLSLTECGRLRSLRHLHVEGCEIGNEGLTHLAGSGWTNLRSLNLEYNRIDDEGLIALSRSPLTGRLATLNLSRNAITDEGAQALADGPPWPFLTRLDLSRNRISSAGARTLLESPSLRNVRRLLLYGNAISIPDEKVLESRYGERVSARDDIPF
jgi:uncharacterized protein (TIGR02996 family)